MLCTFSVCHCFLKPKTRPSGEKLFSDGPTCFFAGSATLVMVVTSPALRKNMKKKRC